MSMGGLTDTVNRLMRAGGSLSMYQGDHFGLCPLDGFDDFILIENGSPGGFNFFNRCSAAASDIDHAAAEDTVDADQHLVARFDEVNKDGLHAG